MEEYKWKKLVKATVHDKEKGRIRVEVPSIDLLKDPNRVEFEPIIQALANCVVGLVEQQEASIKRLQDLQMGKISE